MPIGIQCSRQHPWKTAHNVYVGRGRGQYGRWGNPYTVQEYGREQALARFEAYVAAMAPEALAALLAPLRGKDLACWCPLDQPCHRNVWLRLANP